MPAPYYVDDRAVLYLGDCREILPTLEVPADVMVTDPPYGVGWHSGFASNHGAMAGDDGSLPIAEWIEPALRALRRGRHRCRM